MRILPGLLDTSHIREAGAVPGAMHWHSIAYPAPPPRHAAPETKAGDPSGPDLKLDHAK
jgi:hypothetical protein